MDFKSINKTSVVPFAKNVPLNQLSEDEVFTIKKIRIVETKTKDLGRRIVFNISGNRYVFLPTNPNDYLLSKDDQFKEMVRMISQSHLLFKPLGASGLEFMVSKRCNKCK